MKDTCRRQIFQCPWIQKMDNKKWEAEEEGCMKGEAVFVLAASSADDWEVPLSPAVWMDSSVSPAACKMFVLWSMLYV